MKKKDAEYFRKQLTRRINTLLGHTAGSVSDMTAPKEKLPDPTDRAALEAELKYNLRIKSREKKLIEKIRIALERLDNGTFGICEECGRDISIKRLKARLVTTLCIECKTKEEAFERVLER